MKKLFVVLAVVAIVSLVAAGAAMAGISNSKHNLSNTGPAGRNYSATNTDEICVFCHTPHGAAAGWQPIWNRTVDNTTAFTTYGTTLAGTVAGTPSARTRLCFSCHDGVTALNALNNPPNTAGTVTMAANNTISGNAVVSFDLTDDHPIGIVYNDGVASLRTLTVAAGAAVVKITAINTPTGVTGTSVVECSSCHEPHAENPAFLPLVGGNTASQLCLTCHVK